MKALVPLIEAPFSDAYYQYDSLGYLDAYDAVINSDYAFVAYKETDRSTGEWRVRIKSKQTAGGVFEEAAIRMKAREAGAQGKTYFIWGYNFEPSARDPRQIEFRVYQEEGEPTMMEIFVVTRNANGTAKPPVSRKFVWPVVLT